MSADPMRLACVLNHACGHALAPDEPIHHVIRAHAAEIEHVVRPEPWVLTDMDTELSALEQRREKTRALKQAMMQELLTGRTRLV